MRWSWSSLMLGACSALDAPTAPTADRGACDNDRTRVATINAGIATIAGAEARALAAVRAAEALRPLALRASTESLDDEFRHPIHAAAGALAPAVVAAAAGTPALDGQPLRLTRPGGRVTIPLPDVTAFTPAGLDLTSAGGAQDTVAAIDALHTGLDALHNGRAELAASYRSIVRNTRCPTPPPACPGCAALPAGPRPAVNIGDALAVNAAEGRAVAALVDDGLVAVRARLVRLRALATAAGWDALDSAPDSAAIDDIAATTHFTGISLLDGTDTTMDLQLAAHAPPPLTLLLPDVNTSTLGVDTSSFDGTTGPEAVAIIDDAIARVDAYRATHLATIPLIVAMPDPPPPPVIIGSW